MRLALIQQHASPDRQANIQRGAAAVRKAAEQGANVVAFAELAFDRFHPQEPATDGPPLDLAETIPGPTTEIFSALARELGVVIVLNLYERDGDNAFDSSPVIDADGALLGVTRMLHIAEFDCFHEQGYYTPGDRGAPVYQTQAGRIGVAICYDRHYPEVMRCLGLQQPDLVVIPQAGAVDEWPDGLYHAEVRVAAFQNGYFAALVNRVGREPNLEFAGESFVADCDGRIIAESPKGKDHTLITDIDTSRLDDCCARKLFFRDRRPEIISDLSSPETETVT